MRRRSLWSGASLALLLAAAPLPAATILERSIEVQVRPDGAVSEKTRLRVRLDAGSDFDSWSPYPVYIDENRSLESLTASATRPDGKVLTVARRALDTLEVVGDGELHSSRKLRTVTFPAVPAGSVLAIDYEVRERPYFPAGEIYLAGDDPIESLRVEVRGAGAGWRWRLDGKVPGLEVKETPGGVLVAARGLPRLSPPELAPSGAAAGAVLRYAWGEPSGWEGVGRWYERLVAEVPRGAGPVRDKAREIAAGQPGKREKLEALLAFVRKQVRYVAVEVGIGGYRPHSPQEVLARRWGDCKDKAFLLIDLLREAGIEAYPVLILSSEDDRVDRDFPSAGQFNHAIVAVPADGLGLSADDPVANSYLFLDATQTVGGLSWLHPAAQDQEALIVRGGQGVLVRTPIRQRVEERRLAVDVAIAEEGEASGEARLEMRGQIGAAFLDVLKTGRPEEVDRLIRQAFGYYLTAARLDDPTWAADEAGVPAVTFKAKVRFAATASGAPGAWPTFVFPAMGGLPAPGVLDGRELPVVAGPFSARLSWNVTLPGDVCPPASGQDVAVENALGAFHQKVRLEGRKLFLERHTELRQRWIEPADFPTLKEISLAEHRTNKRRLRWECASPP
ncbi:MAG TPA: DUF3857 domain-containing protein [Thermoanaerobaculia bacterium]